MSKFLCYIDILGFKNKIDEEDFEKCYQKIIKEIIEPFSYPDPDKVFLVSDSIVIISDNFQNIISNAFSIYSIAFKNGIFFRGAVTKGKVNEYSPIKEKNNAIILPYLGEAYLNAYKLEASINTAAIHVDDKIIKELSIENKKLIFKFKEPFPKNNENREKYFLISDMNNYDVPQTLLYNISRQISKLSNDQTNKFLNTFCLYYSVMVKQHEDTNNLKKYNEWWIDILNRLSNTGITSG